MARIRLAFALAAALLPGAGAAEYWVDQRHQEASDANPGTRERPWLTVGHAAASLRPGDLVRVRPGIYREHVVPRRSGTPQAPITYRAEGRGVVLSGADALGGWRAGSPRTCPGHPHAARLWLVDLEWEPDALFFDGKPLAKAREPNRGWWTAQGGGTHTLVDAKHLRQPEGAWVGATVFFWDVSATTQGWRKVVGYDPQTHTLELAKPIWRDRVVEGGKDRYYLEGKLAILDRPGEWAVEPAGQRFRLYLWPPGDAEPADHLVEAPRRSRFVLEYGDRKHLRIHGFEVRHGAGHGIGSWSRGAEDIRIAQCWVHHNQGNGIYVRFATDVSVRGNLVCHNHNGLTAGSVARLRVAANEIADNAFDGLVVSHGSREVVIRRNYIHGHTLWGHPDNVQFHNGLQDVRIEENVLLDGGQSLMMEQCEDGVLRGNVVVGAAAYSVILGHRNVHRFQLLGNTIAFTRYGTVSFTGTHATVRGNILCPGGRGAVYAVAQTEGFASDYNLLYRPPGAPGCFAAYARNWPDSFAAYRELSGQEAHSVCAPPRFANAPALCVPIDGRRLGECTAARLAVRAWEGALRPGDHVEVKFDGVVRTVQRAGPDHVVVDPPLEAPPEKGGLVLNWREKTDFALDLRPAPDSPARGAGPEGGDLGADLDIAAFARGDSDGDGRPDIRRAE
ncbi:MAG: right-handed parallel beta-helix repeat-containing protein [Candidatus Brocadiia bacterium]